LNSGGLSVSSRTTEFGAGLEAGMTIAELVYEQVKTLPDHMAREVLDFVGYLRERGEWRDLMNAQSVSLAPVWDTVDDKVWDDV